MWQRRTGNINEENFAVLRFSHRYGGIEVIIGVELKYYNVSPIYVIGAYFLQLTIVLFSWTA